MKKAITALIWLNIFNFLDALITLGVVGVGAGTECNPLVALISLPVTFGLKVIIVPIASLLLFRVYIEYPKLQEILLGIFWLLNLLFIAVLLQNVGLVNLITC